MLRFALLGTLIGCGGKLSEDEAQDVFTGTMLVVGDVQTQVGGSLSGSAAAKDLTVDGSADDASLSGTIEGSGIWTGTVTVDGSASYSSEDWSYALSLGFEDVHTASPDLTLNGAVDTAMSGSTSGGAYHYEYALSGALDVSGDANGSADFDFEVVVDVDPTSGSYSYEASGDISGYDVSGMTGGLSGAF